MIQLVLLSFVAAIFGVVFCLAAVTDPNQTPSRQRQSLFPIGLCLILVPLGFVLGAFAGAGVVWMMDPVSELVGRILALAVFGMGGIGGLAAGIWLGAMRNRRFWASAAGLKSGYGA